MSRYQKYLLVWFIIGSEKNEQEWETFAVKYRYDVNEIWTFMKQMESDQAAIEGRRSVQYES